MSWDTILYYYEMFIEEFGNVFKRIVRRFFGG